MALESGPTTLPTSLSVASCIETLTKLNRLCNEKMAYHQANLEIFKATFAIRDLREIKGRYADPEHLLEPLASSAHFYSLTIQGTMTVLIYGTEGLLEYFKTKCNKDIDNTLATLQQSTFLLAQIKLSADQLLHSFLKNNPNIDPKSPSELHKIALQKNSEAISTGIQSLTELERLSIEYFEMTLKAENILKALDSYEKELQELSKQLQHAEPLATPTTSRETIQATSSTPMEAFEKGLDVPEGKNLDSDALTAQLASRLNLTGSSSSEDDPSRWDGFPSRTPSPLPVAPGSTALLTQYQIQPALPAAASQSSSVSPSDEERQRLGL